MGEFQTSCPGRDGRNLTAEEVTCPECGYSVEFFSDEKFRKCPSCSFKVNRAASSDCGQWCPAAADCALLRGGTSSPKG
jgi:DNA-directed RNA polymerase subunit RPC12/RpoP